MPEPAVVISPHLDDAVLSASARLAAGGAQVLTVFAGLPPAGTPAPVWDRLTGATDPVVRMRERYAEDDEALARLGGVPSTRLDHLDEQYRQALPGTMLDPDLLVRDLAAHCAGAAEIWLPAGVGGNGDHAVVRAAALAAAGSVPAATVYLYADFPYVRRAGGWPSWATGRPPGRYLDAAVWVAAELAEAGLPVPRLEPVTRELDPAEQARKRHAIEAYRTQLPALDLGRSRLDADPELLRYELAWRLRQD